MQYLEPSSPSTNRRFTAAEKGKGRVEVAQPTMYGQLEDSMQRDGGHGDGTTTIPRKRSHIAECDSDPPTKIQKTTLRSEESMEVDSTPYSLGSIDKNVPTNAWIGGGLGLSGGGSGGYGCADKDDGFEEAEEDADNSDGEADATSSDDEDSASFSEEEKKQPYPELPTEVWERIIEFVAVRKVDYWNGNSDVAKNLKTCAKVCWSWHHRSLFHLRRFPILGYRYRERPVMPFFDAIRQFPDTPFVKMELHVRKDSQEDVVLVPFLLTRNHKYASSINHLRIRGIYELTLLDASCHPNFLMACKSSFSSVTTLYLRQVEFSSISFFARFLLSFRSLARLFLHHVDFQKEEVPITQVVVPQSRRLRLRSLFLDLQKQALPRFIQIFRRHMAWDKLERLFLRSTYPEWSNLLPPALPSLNFIALDNTSPFYGPPGPYKLSRVVASQLNTLYLRTKSFIELQGVTQHFTTRHIHTLKIYLDWDYGLMSTFPSFFNYLLSQAFPKLRHVNIQYRNKDEYPQILQEARILSQTLEMRGGRLILQGNSRFRVDAFDMCVDFE